MKNSYKYFENKECKYYPCHEGIEHMNCMFCYCPLYHMEHCPGDKLYIELNGQRIKECTKCAFPHKEENYDCMMKILKNKSCIS